MKNFFELVNDERKSSDILPMKACSAVAYYDDGCAGAVDAGANGCTGYNSVDDCGGYASDYSYCTGRNQHDGHSGPV
ncbi:MAG TPA: hypothetical protein VHO66_09605 [Ruminiclostridium sp.]|nr:hypothetical protein [Ruminiclostridium sp.]